MDENSEARVKLQHQYLLKQIGDTVKGKRKELKLTQKDLADQINTTQSVVAEVEKGKAKLSMTTLAKFFTALGLPLDIRLTPRDQKPKTKVVQYLDSGTVYVFIGELTV